MMFANKFENPAMVLSQLLKRNSPRIFR
jgi:hypothetical protein